MEADLEKSACDKHAKGAYKISKTLFPTSNAQAPSGEKGAKQEHMLSVRTANGASAQVETVTFRRSGFPNSNFIFEQAPLGPGAGNNEIQETTSPDSVLASPYRNLLISTNIGTSSTAEP